MTTTSMKTTITVLNQRTVFRLSTEKIMEDTNVEEESLAFRPGGRAP